MKKTNMHIHLIAVIVLSFITSGCSETIETTKPEQAEVAIEAPILDTQQNSINTNKKSPEKLFISLINQHLSRSTTRAEQLNQHVISFAKAPNEDALQKAIALLKTTHNDYLSYDILRRCCFGTSGMNTREGASISLHAKLDQYPLLPGYIDSVDGYPYSGLVHTDTPITAEAMLKEFQLGDPHYVTLGFHALEVLLNGSNGDRAADDFQALSATNDTSSSSPELRRTLYAILLASEIKTDLSKAKASMLRTIQSTFTLKNEAQTTQLFSQLTQQIEQALVENKTKLAELNSHLSPTSEHLNADILNERKIFLEKLLTITRLQPSS